MINASVPNGAYRGCQELVGVTVAISGVASLGELWDTARNQGATDVSPTRRR